MPSMGFAARMAAIALPCAIAAASSSAALAADLSRPLPPPTAKGFPSGWEVRAGVYAHDASSPEAGSADASFGVLTPALFSLGDNFSYIVPRLQAGATINFAGRTSIGYAGIAVDYNFSKTIFLEGTFGGAVNNGRTGNVIVPGHNAVGCVWSFHESGSIGYRLTENWSILATIEHMSNAGFCRQNRGVTNYGARIAYTF